MKNVKTNRFLLSVVLVVLIQLIFSFQTFASDGIVISVGDGEAVCGGEVTLGVNISQNVGIAGLKVELYYDKNMLTPVSISKNSAFDGRFDSNMLDNGADLENLDAVSIVWTTTKGEKLDGDLCYITFRVSENADKYISVNITQGDREDIFDNDFNNVSAELIGGKIKVTDAVGVDKDNLKATADEARNYLGEVRYTTASLNALENKIIDAEAVYSAEDASQDEVNSAIAAICEAVDSLEVKTFAVNVRESKNSGVAEGITTVKYGTSAVFDIVCDEGYLVSEVLVDDKAVSLVDNTLTIENITSNKSVVIMCEKKVYSINAEDVQNGQIVLSRKTVKHGEKCLVKLVADTGYIIGGLIIDGVNVGAQSEYTIEGICENHVVDAVFVRESVPYTITAKSNTGGNISPVKSIVNSGSTAVFVLKPDYGYEAVYVMYGAKQYAVTDNMVVIDDISADMAIEAYFAKKSFNVSLICGDGGIAVIKYDGFEGSDMAVTYKDTAVVEITPEAGYELKSVYADNVGVKAEFAGNGRYVYNVVAEGDIHINVIFRRDAISTYRDKVELSGVPYDVTRDNARQMKAKFEMLKKEFAELTESEKIAAANAYGCVLAVIDRVNAYILLEECGIEGLIDSLPMADDVTSENIDLYEENILLAEGRYEELTTLAQRLISYDRQRKIEELVGRVESIKLEKVKRAEYFHSLVDKASEDITTDNVIRIYTQLKSAQDFYDELTEVEKAEIDSLRIAAMNDGLSHAMAMLCTLYADPFVAAVKAQEKILPSDTETVSEGKRTAIFALMKEYSSMPACAKGLVPENVVDKLDDLYESACVTVSGKVDGETVLAVGSIDVEETLEITRSNDSISDNLTGDEAVDMAIDVRLLENGVEVQPKSVIQLKMPITDEIAENSPKVVYVDDEGNAYDMQSRIVSENGKKYILWSTDHFSCFAVVFDVDKSIRFDSDTFTAGEEITAKVGAGFETDGCTLWCAGYNKDNGLEFVKKGTDGKVSVVPNTDTVKIKAMLWKDMEPVLYEELNSK